MNTHDAGTRILDRERISCSCSQPIQQIAKHVASSRIVCGMTGGVHDAPCQFQKFAQIDNANADILLADLIHAGTRASEFVQRVIVDWQARFAAVPIRVWIVHANSPV